MEYYRLTLHVTLEQELAIRELFVYKGWPFKKHEVAVIGEDFSLQNSVKVLTSPSSISSNSSQSWLEMHTNNTLNAASFPAYPSVDEDHGQTPSNSHENTCHSLYVEFPSDTQHTILSDLKNFVGEAHKAETNTSNEQEKLDGIVDETATSNHVVYKTIDCSIDIDKTVSSNTKTETVIEIQSNRKYAENLQLKEISMNCSEINKDPNNEKIQEIDFNQTNRAHTIKNNTQNRLKMNINKKKTKVGLFHCKECNFTFKLLGAFQNHKRDSKCVFSCNYCGKIFTSRYYSNYLSHLKYHKKERPHKCDVCGKTYIEEQTLKIHIRTHTGDRPYVCDHCGKRFYSSSHLLCHKNNMHSEKLEVFKCDVCSAVLSTLGNLRVHKKTVHVHDRPYSCEICGKAFKTRKSLEQVHATVHMAVYPFRCDFNGCGKTFKRAEGLSDHKRRHNNERSHFCDNCGKGFYGNKDLLLHKRTHTGEKPYECSVCGYRCALAGNLTKHGKIHL